MVSEINNEVQPDPAETNDRLQLSKPLRTQGGRIFDPLTQDERLIAQRNSATERAWVAEALRHLGGTGHPPMTGLETERVWVSGLIYVGHWDVDRHLCEPFGRDGSRVVALV